MIENSIARPQVDELLFQFMKRIYRWEREIDAVFGLDYQQIYLLQHLRKASPARVSEISRELQIPLFKTTRLISHLAEQEYLVKTKIKDDKRVVMVSILPKGEEVLSTIEERSYHIISENSKLLSEEEIKAFVFAASNIDRILEIPQKDPGDPE